MLNIQAKIRWIKGHKITSFLGGIGILTMIQRSIQREFDDGIRTAWKIVKSFVHSRQFFDESNKTKNTQVSILETCTDVEKINQGVFTFKQTPLDIFYKLLNSTNILFVFLKMGFGSVNYTNVEQNPQTYNKTLRNDVKSYYKTLANMEIDIKKLRTICKLQYTNVTINFPRILKTLQNSPWIFHKNNERFYNSYNYISNVVSTIFDFSAKNSSILTQASIKAQSCLASDQLLTMIFSKLGIKALLFCDQYILCIRGEVDCDFNVNKSICDLALYQYVDLISFFKIKDLVLTSPYLDTTVQFGCEEGVSYECDKILKRLIKRYLENFDKATGYQLNISEGVDITLNDTIAQYKDLQELSKRYSTEEKQLFNGKSNGVCLYDIESLFNLYTFNELDCNVQCFVRGECCDNITD